MDAELRRILAGSLRFVLLAVLAVIGVMQMFSPETTNPPADPASSFEAVAQPPRQVAAILNRACLDCHSHNTRWPWYSQVWPVSAMVVRDVQQGRLHMNFSNWRGLSPDATRQRMAGVCEEARKGDMPPRYYLPLHRQARLSSSDVSTLCAWTISQH